MQNLAVLSISPRSIAWLVRHAEWERLEQIINYNCAMVGGYFNVLVPLTENDTLNPLYEKLLFDYDPDIIVLAPGMNNIQYHSPNNRPYPFITIQWEAVPSIATLDPAGFGPEVNGPVNYFSMLSEDFSNRGATVAVSSEEEPDTSRLALFACGDVAPRSGMWHSMDDDMSFDSWGYREHFLTKVIATGIDENRLRDYMTDEGERQSPPDRSQLRRLIRKEYQFPLSGASEIIKTCCELQHRAFMRYSFITLTAAYKNSGQEFDREWPKEREPSLFIIVSDHFDVEQAILFWNLRANNVHVSWLSYSAIEADTDDLGRWLESDYGGKYYGFLDGMRAGIAFSAPKGELDRLNNVVNALQVKRMRSSPEWSVVEQDTLIKYNFVRPHIKQDQITLLQDGSRLGFIPQLPPEAKEGTYAASLKWDGMKIPQKKALIDTLISSESIRGGFYQIHESSPFDFTDSPRFRVTGRRYLRAQFSGNKPIEFYRPSIEQIVKVLFDSYGLSRIEESSAARYHREFVTRSGGLEGAAKYLVTSPYKELLETLSDNRDEKKPGWILKTLKRRALHHLHLLKVLRCEVPVETESYINTISDQLPEEAVLFLEKGLLERGFQLKCKACSFSSWYPAEHVGQRFECARCFQTQVYPTNPLWLYKLPEVLFQGFEHNMHVPLLTLNYLQSKESSGFEWMPDSDVHYSDGSTEVSRNIDLICMSNGRIYIGEAKSNDNIEPNQFSFYEELSHRLPIDGIIFATSQKRWGQGTSDHINKFRTEFNGEVIVVTHAQLYPEGM